MIMTFRPWKLAAAVVGGAMLSPLGLEAGRVLAPLRGAALPLMFALDVAWLLLTAWGLGSLPAAALVGAIVNAPLIVRTGVLDEGPWLFALALEKYALFSLCAVAAGRQASSVPLRWLALAVSLSGLAIALARSVA